MYSNFRSVQILIALMKKNNIQDVVLSPGGSDIPLIHSIETDKWFRCYSVVDERSAAYFAMGLAQAKNKFVTCICTSGSAVCNYLPGITEAYYQSVPVLAITADKNPYYQGQLETQKIEQQNIFNGVVKKAISLPLIRDSEDEWLCNRLVNEAIIELAHHGKGPVHINVPIVGATDIYDCEVLPDERQISLVDLHSDEILWKSYEEKIRNAHRVLVVVGQNLTFSEETIRNMDTFFENYNCIFSVEHLSNLCCKGCVYTYPVSEMCGGEVLKNLAPDLILSLGNNLAAYSLKPFLRRIYKNTENWYISETGILRDAYKSLTTIFECTIDEFFSEIMKEENTEVCEHEYYEAWIAELDKIKLPEFSFSNFYVAQKLADTIPENSLLHLAILNSTRVMQFFGLQKGVKTYSNVGTLGIDGCFSTFAGQAVGTDQLSYLLIGDLSFFYDMNAAGLRSISPNVRVILLNNGGGSEFHFFVGRDRIPTINQYICAEHCKTAEGWIKSLGYEYYSAHNEVELQAALKNFGETSEKPLFLEVFTEMEDDAEKTRKMYQDNNKSAGSSNVKGLLKSVLSDKQIGKAKKILKIIKES